MLEARLWRNLTTRNRVCGENVSESHEQQEKQQIPGTTFDNYLLWPRVHVRLVVGISNVRDSI